MKDTELKSIIKHSVRQDAGNPYFVRKVLNRLPERPKSVGYTWVLWLACGLGALILALLWGHYISTFSVAHLRPVYFLSLWATTLLVVFVGLRALLSRPLH